MAKCTVSIRHDRNMCFGPTWTHLDPTSAQLGSASITPATFPMLFVRWAQLGAKLSAKGPKLRHFGRGLGPPYTCPRCAMLDFVGLNSGPSWSQLARVRRKLGPNLVRPNSRPMTAKFDLVGPSTPARFLSIQFSGIGGCRREAIRIKTKS